MPMVEKAPPLVAPTGDPLVGAAVPPRKHSLTAPVLPQALKPRCLPGSNIGADPHCRAFVVGPRPSSLAPLATPLPAAFRSIPMCMVLEWWDASPRFLFS
jgi:hypothetical protein